MINLKLFCESLKLTWLRRLELSDSSWTILLKHSLPSWFTSYHYLGNTFIQRINDLLNPFWKEVFSHLLDLRNSCSDNIINTPIWCNNNLKFNNEDMFIHRWFNKGVLFRPNKKVCVFPVYRPSLFFPSDPKTFYCV